MELFSVLNGLLWEPNLIHLCSGPDCCPEGRATTIKRLFTAIMNCVLRLRPGIPTKSRWATCVASIDFWLPLLMVHRLAVWLFAALLHELGMTGPTSKQHFDELLHVLRTCDPELQRDSTDYFRALRGVRLKRTFEALSKASTIVNFILGAMFLGSQRYPQQFLDKSCRSVRAKRYAKGLPTRPPIFDLVNARHSPIRLVEVWLSNILAIDCDAAVLDEENGAIWYIVLYHYTMVAAREAEMTMTDLHDRIRIGACS